MSANERTFQGELYRIINGILSTSDEIKFSKITQEENVGTKGKARFADGKLYSSNNSLKIVSFELKNSKWDATDNILVEDAAKKAMSNGYKYFVTGTPRQLAVYRTFEEGVPLPERKLKIYTISNVLKDNDILSPYYEKEITPKVKEFLKELSDIVHEVKEVHWDSIDKVFVNKLSAYILEASAEMLNPMYEKVRENKGFREKLRAYLKSQDIFNVTLSFDAEDIYKICQLANYLLYLKLMFYSYLQKDVPELNLIPLEIPEDKDLLNKVLRDRFNDVLKHDFELIFSENILDEFNFEAKYIPILKNNVEQIKHLNFNDLNVDVIGSIYNTLIDNQEQHDRGQHFTNTNEVDIVNGFCINQDTQYLLDSGCGAGTFLVRGYSLLKEYNKNLEHQKLLERTWGIEIAPFPAFLSVMNLSLLNIKALDNYPVIIQSDFSKVSGSFAYNGIFLNVNKTFNVKKLDGKKSEVKIPAFDACIGNPPYIRQELIENKTEWSNLARGEFGLNKINQQSDLYVYYLIHTAAFLKEGGRLGYVISSSWLDVSFGTGLQKFLLDNFKIITVIDHQKTRSFETALINTVILILEKCSDEDERKANNTKFVRIFTDYRNFIGSISDSDRFEKVKNFTNYIENTESNIKNDSLQIEVINQFQLEQNSTFKNKYTNGYWGAKYLRSPEIYNKVISHTKNNFVPLDDIAEVSYGIKTGANEFFYLIDETYKAREYDEETYRLIFGVNKSKQDLFWANYGWFRSELTGENFIIEREFVRPVYKSQKEAENLDVNLSKLKYVVLYCNLPKSSLIRLKKQVLKYIERGESREFQIDKRPSVSGRANWYDLTSIANVGDFIFPSKIGERFRLIDNRNSQVFCDKVNYIIDVRPQYNDYKDVIFLYLNSTLFRYLIDLFSRQMVVKVSDVDVNLVEKTLVIKPDLLKKHWHSLASVYTQLKSREQKTIYEEVLMQDRTKLDSIIFSILGLEKSDVDDLHKEACKYVKDRQEKSESLSLAKSKKTVGYDDALTLVKDRFPEIRLYKNLIKGLVTTNFNIPNGKAAYPKNGIGTNNLFGIYALDFTEGKTHRTLEFAHPEQFELFEFLNRTLEIKGESVKLPEHAEDCNELLKEVIHDFDMNISQVKNYLKSIRSSANFISIYRDLLFPKKNQIKKLQRFQINN